MKWIIKKKTVYEVEEKWFRRFRAGEPRIGVYTCFDKASKIIE